MMKGQNKIFGSICILLCFLLMIRPCGVSAAEKITIDDSVYSLYVDEYPEGIYNGIYAKFRTTKSNNDDYYLNLSSEESEETFEKALTSAKVNFSGKLTCSMNAVLYKESESGDPVKATDSIELLLAIPDDAQEHEEDCTLYMVSGGSAKKVSATRCVDEDGVYYDKFVLSSYTTYGYVFNDPESYDTEEEEEPDDEDEDEDDSDNEDEDEDNDDVTPTVTPKPTATPTPKPSSKNDSSVKDSIPKTGDDFPLIPLMLVGGAAAFSLGCAICKIKR